MQHIASMPRLSGAAARKLERLQAAAIGAMHGSPAAQELAAFVAEWQASGADPATLAERAEAEEVAAEEAAVKAQAQAEADAKAQTELEAAAKRKAAQPKGLARDQSAHIARVAALLEKRDHVLGELAKTLATAERLFREGIDLGQRVASGWPFSSQDQLVALLAAPRIANAVATEIYRIGARPHLGGNPLARAEVSFPGGRCDNIQFRGQPDKLPPLSDVLKRRWNPIPLRTGAARGSAAPHRRTGRPQSQASTPECRHRCQPRSAAAAGRPEAQ